MKINRYGQAKVLTQPELELIFSDGLQTQRDRTLFGVCLYTACRIAEACTLLTSDVFNAKEVVRSHLVIRRTATKGQLDTRTIPILDDLRLLLLAYQPDAGKNYLFPGQWGRGHLHPDSAARILRTACALVGIEGVSTHSFRRTALTQMSNSGIPLRVIQKISGHRSLTQLQAYLDVQPEQVTGAIASLAMLGVSQRVVKYNYDDPQPESPIIPSPEPPPF